MTNQQKINLLKFECFKHGLSISRWSDFKTAVEILKSKKEWR